MDKKQLETSDTKNELKWCESKQTEENPEQSLAGGGADVDDLYFSGIEKDER